MKKFLIKYAGIMNSSGEEEVEAETAAELESYAEELANEDYDSYAGLHGIRTTCEIMEEDDLDEEGARETYCEERASETTWTIEEIA